MTSCGLMDHLKIERAHLVGHSMGALIAANVAARYPARVTSAALDRRTALSGSKPRSTAPESRRWTADLESGAGLVDFVQVGCCQA